MNDITCFALFLKSTLINSMQPSLVQGSLFTNVQLTNVPLYLAFVYNLTNYAYASIHTSIFRMYVMRLPWNQFLSKRLYIRSYIE